LLTSCTTITASVRVQFEVTVKFPPSKAAKPGNDKKLRVKRFACEAIACECVCKNVTRGKRLLRG